MSDKTILVWFRNDLRVSDNEILLEATRKADKVLPLYVFDPYYFTTNDDGLQKTGAIRAKFLIESVTDLRQSLQRLGGDLMIRIGDPAEIIPQIAQQYQVNEVYHHREVSFEETAISEKVEAALWKIKLNLKHFIGHTLYHKEDLPFPIKDIPDSFNIFKKKVERDSVVRPSVPAPDKIAIPDNFEAGNVPSLADIGLEELVTDARARFVFTGGEAAGKVQLQSALNKSVEAVAKNNKSGLQAFISGLSPWITIGCLSPREVYWAFTSKFQHQNNPVAVDLLWRDYFRFMFKKHGSARFFNPEGFKNEAPEVAADENTLFNKWKDAATGNEAVDAAITELNLTGYIPNNLRQLVADYLVQTLKADWTRGARWFEAKLIDYSPASNWGNWSFVAGVGNDIKFIDSFKTPPAPREEYVELWLAPAVKTA